MATKTNRYMLDSVAAQERHARVAIASLRSNRDPVDESHYPCPELRPDNNRPGSCDFLACPSLISGQHVMPRAFDSHKHVINPARLQQL